MAKGACYAIVVYSDTEQCRAHWTLDKGVGKSLNFCKFMQVMDKREIIWNVASLLRAGYLRRYSDSLRLDGPGIDSRGGTRFYAPVQTGSGAHPAYCTMGTGVVSQLGGPGFRSEYRTRTRKSGPC